MTTTCWNDGEDERLQGLPIAAQVLYLRGMRRHMDFQDGLVGMKRRISWQAIREVLYVEPHQGAGATGAPSKDQVRRLAALLERAGLVEIRSDMQSKRLVFFLPLAFTDESVQKNIATKPPLNRHTQTATDTATRNLNNGGAMRDNTAIDTATKPPHPKTPDTARHPKSGIPVKDIKASTRATPLVEKKNSATNSLSAQSTTRSLLPPVLVRKSERAVVLTDSETSKDLAELQLPTPARKARDTASKGVPAPSSATWAAYSSAYRARYHVDPIRNAAVNGQLAHLVARLGAQEAPLVAAYYLTRNDRWYADCGHSTDALLRHWQKLRTEWVTTQTPNLPTHGDQAPIPNRPSVVRL